MKNKKLQEILSQFPDDAEVFKDDCEYGLMKISENNIEYRQYRKTEFDIQTPEKFDENEVSTEKVITI